MSAFEFHKQVSEDMKLLVLDAYPNADPRDSLRPRWSQISEFDLEVL